MRTFCVPIFVLALVLLGTVRSEKWAIEFEGNPTEAQRAAEAFSVISGLRYDGRIGMLSAFEFSAPEVSNNLLDNVLNATREVLRAIESGNAFSAPKHPIAHLQRLYESSQHLAHMSLRSEWSSVLLQYVRTHHIRWVSEILPKRFEKRSELVSIHDPLYNAQYHLHERTASLATLNVVGAWDSGITGAGVLIAIVDDGLEHNHPDIFANYRADASYNFDYNRPDPGPSNMIADYHGTSSAGVAAARDDGTACGVGVAYRASLAGLSILQRDYLDDAKDSRALQYKLDLNHIYSNSWGPQDGGVGYEGPGPLTRQAIELGVATGRNGLGAVYVWAGGNGGSVDNCNYDGYASMRTAVTVGAVDASGFKSSFSEECASLLVVAPSASNDRSYIRTTDLMGRNGRAAGDCNLAFSGTSAACPAVAGVVALILEVNPGLGWLDVQRVLIETAHKTDPSSPTWQQNGAGYWVSHYYGFGLADATAAVAKARTLRDVPNLQEIVLSYQDLEGTAWTSQTSGKYGVILEIPVTEETTIHHVEFVVGLITTPDAGKLDVTLISPAGTPSTLAKSHRVNHANLRNWVYTSRRLWGENSRGTWRIIILDTASAGSLSSYSIRIWSSPSINTYESVYKRREGDAWIPVSNTPTSSPSPRPTPAPTPIAHNPRPTPAPIIPPAAIPEASPNDGVLEPKPTNHSKEIAIIIVSSIIGLAVTAALLLGIYYYWKSNLGSRSYGSIMDNGDHLDEAAATGIYVEDDGDGLLAGNNHPFEEAAQGDDDAILELDSDE